MNAYLFDVCPRVTGIWSTRNVTRGRWTSSVSCCSRRANRTASTTRTKWYFPASTAVGCSPRAAGTGYRQSSRTVSTVPSCPTTATWARLARLSRAATTSSGPTGCRIVCATACSTAPTCRTRPPAATVPRATYIASLPERASRSDPGATASSIVRAKPTNAIAVSVYTLYYYCLSTDIFVRYTLNM